MSRDYERGFRKGQEEAQNRYQKEIELLQKALLRHGRHTDNCDTHHGGDCTCGIEIWRKKLNTQKGLRR